MTVNLLATQCPAPQGRTAFLSIAAGGSLPNGNSQVFEGVRPGTGAAANNWSAGTRRDGVRSSILGAFGGGGYAVAMGLTLTAGAGLSVTVGQGIANLDGPVAVESPTALALPGTSPVYVWLTPGAQTPPGTASNPALPVYTTTTAPPTGPACYLGRVTTSGGAITGIDVSGVLSLRGGLLFRQTADAGVPGDAPPSGLALYTTTQGGVYLWNGYAYGQVGQGGGLGPTGTPTTTPAANFAAAFTVLSASGTITRPADQLFTFYCDTTSGNQAQTLPPATGAWSWLEFKNVGANALTVQAAGTDLIDGAATFTLQPDDSITVKDYTSGKWAVH